MVAKSRYRLPLACLLFAFLASVSAQQSRHNTDTVPPSRTDKQKQGLVDFTLDRITKEGRDYGQCLDEGRRLLIEETFDRAYFWSNLLAIGVLLCLFLVIVHQHRSLHRRELIAAESLTQYHNALARAEAQAEEATRRNHALMEVLNATPRLISDGESGAAKLKKDPGQTRSSVATVPVSAVAAVKSNSSKPVPVSPPAVHAAAPVVAPTPAERPDNGTKPANQMGLFSPDVDLIAKINSLQQQLNTAQEREKQLRRQLNDSDLRLQKEQQRNRSLQA